MGRVRSVLTTLVFLEGAALACPVVAPLEDGDFEIYVDRTAPELLIVNNNPSNGNIAVMQLDTVTGEAAAAGPTTISSLYVGDSIINGP